MYSKLAQSVTACADAQEFAKIIAEMREKFRERVPDETEFTVPFARLTYRANYTRERNLVRYALTHIARHHGMPEEVDLSMLTIEHILAQSQGDESDDEFDVGAIGNLIFVNESVNGKLGTKSFKEKMKLFNSSNNVYMDDYLTRSTEWSEINIGERGVELAEIGYNKIRTI